MPIRTCRLGIWREDQIIAARWKEHAEDRFFALRRSEQGTWMTTTSPFTNPSMPHLPPGSASLSSEDPLAGAIPVTIPPAGSFFDRM